MDNQVTLRRPVVYIASGDKANFLRYASVEQKQKISPNIQIISEEYLSEVRKNNIFSLPKNVFIGDILTIHPYEPNKYVHVQELVEETMSSLYSCVSEIARHLGATMIEWTKSCFNEGIRTRNAKGEIKITPYGNLSANFKSKEENSHNSEERKRIDYNVPKNISLEERLLEYEKAKKTAKKYGLEDLNDVRELIDGRDPLTSIKIRTKEVTIRMSSKINFVLDAAFSLMSIGDIFNVDGDVKDSIIQHQKIECRYVIHFDQEIEE